MIKKKGPNRASQRTDVRKRRKTHRRGRTRPERLKLLDELLASGALPLDFEASPLLVDVGYGDEPLTTVELHRRFSSAVDDLTTIGVEVETSRVERAQSHATPRLRFVLGSFDLGEAGIEQASLIRCFNVLRGYGIWDIKKALLSMSAALRSGGLLIEGTSDVAGTLLACHIWQRSAQTTMRYLGLVCATDFSRGFSPMMFRDVFPRDIRRHGQPGEPSFDWLSSWEQLVTELRRSSSKADGAAHNRALFLDSARRLAHQDDRTDADHAEDGVLIFRPERPSTRPEVLSPDDPIRSS